jgi:hypothetical protein
MLRDRNTVRMVAEHWGCSPDTVYRRLGDGTLACLRIAGMIRVTREQVEACEVAATVPGAQLSAAALRRARQPDPFELGRRIAGEELRRAQREATADTPTGATPRSRR